MPRSAEASVRSKLDALRTGLADLAFALERQGRRDAADVVMMIDHRVREMAEEVAPADGSEEARPRLSTAGVVFSA